MEMGNMAKPRSVSCGFRLRSAIQYCPMTRARCFSSSYAKRSGEKNDVVRTGKRLPWLASNRAKELKGLEKGTSTKTSRSSWGESAKRLEKVRSRSSWEESEKRVEEATTMRSARSSWKSSAENFVGSEEDRNGIDIAEDRKSGYDDRDGSFEEDNEKVEENKQENWGRKTWKEATESTVPKMGGEGIYGVGPVLGNLLCQLEEENFMHWSGSRCFAIGDGEEIKELDPASVEEDKGSLVMMGSRSLDEVTDPQNLGAIIRSRWAYFFGIASEWVVWIAEKPEYGRSAYFFELQGWCYVPSWLLPWMRSCLVHQQFLDEVLGSEGTGLRPLVERSCTQLIRIPGNIPMDLSTGGANDMETAETNSGCSSEEFRSFLAVESLNVSVAAGVLLHHLIGTNYKNECHIGDESTDALE
uniref:tRNA/rRNA methyltransferase SpoU type domain-containing protein n=1 Tax=Fagus sylvatica TaxID=28930 RepID=A0A2N9H6J1_FAGSY